MTRVGKQKHRRTTHRRRMRGGMFHLNDGAIRAKQLMYAMLFSPNMQSNVPLGVQFEIILDNSPNCDYIRDGRVPYYSATPMDYNKRMTTVHELLKFYLSGGHELVKLIHDLVDGCRAELELKESVASVKELVGGIQTTHLAPQSSLSRRISSLMFQPDPPLSPQELMENFKLDVDNFAFKVANLYNLYYAKKRKGRQPVYTHVSSELHQVAHFKIRPQMERIKKSFEARLKMLELLRDVALPKMIEMYHANARSHAVIPEALFSDNPNEFEENVERFRAQLDEFILQQKYAMGLQVAPTRMLRTISHVPNGRSSSSSLRPLGAAIRDARRSLTPFSVDPSDIAQLKGHGALARLLAERLSSHGSDKTRKRITYGVSSWHKDNDNDNDNDPETDK